MGMKPGAWSERRGHPPDVTKEQLRRDGVEHLPSVLASDFVEGRWFGSMERGTHDRKQELINNNRLLVVHQFDRREVLPILGESLLTIDACIGRQEGGRKLRHQVFFEYLPTDTEDLSSSDTYAQMHINIHDHSRMELVHRYVHVGLRDRGLGLGTRLWKTTESWLGQVAAAQQKEVEVFLGVGQPRVMRWVEKMGFEVRKEDQELREWIRTEPRAFVEDQVSISTASRAQGVVKNPYLFHRSQRGRYMEDAIRLRYVKTIPVPEKS